jgi:hypothetical protein
VSTAERGAPISAGGNIGIGTPGNARMNGVVASIGETLVATNVPFIEQAAQ